MSWRVRFGAVAIVVALLFYFFARGPSLSEGELASKFYRDHAEELQALISSIRPLPKGSRVERENIELPSDCQDIELCRSSSLQAQSILKRIDAPVLVINETCSGSDRCSVSVVFRRKGIAVSGSGTELIYDTAPAWGRFKITPVTAAPKNWYYRHLGD